MHRIFSRRVAQCLVDVTGPGFSKQFSAAGGLLFDAVERHLHSPMPCN